MTEQPSGAQSRAPAKAGALVALIAAAVVAVQPLTSASEGERFRAYLDPKKIPTICRGHTGPEVHLGMVATKAQCDAWYRQDMAAKMKIILRMTPQLAEQRSALQAGGDFAFNAGEGWWRVSPMARQFSQRQWRAGCEAFRGYVDGINVARPDPRFACRPRPSGGWHCPLPGLGTRRENERKVCLTGL